MRAGVRYGLLGCGAALVLAAGGWFALGRPQPSAVMAALPWSDKPTEAAETEPPLTVTVVAARTESVPISFTYTARSSRPRTRRFRPV